MEASAINSVVNQYISDNLSPKPEQRDYIDDKYDELKAILDGNTFRSGSYARYTAIDPVHDLDVIYPVDDRNLETDPNSTIQSVLNLLRTGYAKSSTRVKSIEVQTHSVTVLLADAPDGDFSIDVVPAVKIDELNNYGDNLFMVPEILQLNHHNREQRYLSASSDKPIGWIKSDPKGYRKAATVMNASNSNFRHAVKLVKRWRHACKMEYKDQFRLKSFHLEQIVYNYFTDHPQATTIEAVTESLASLPYYLRMPQIADRADPLKFIDEYIGVLTTEQRHLILKHQSQALDYTIKLGAQDTPKAVVEQLKKILVMTPLADASPPRQVSPNRPWAF